jgi:hypothetical protein
MMWVAVIPSSLCVVAAASIAICGKGGWGWFLFAAFILAPMFWGPQ